MPITLVQLWTQERDTRKAAQAAAKDDLTIAQTGAAAARKQLDTDAASLKQLIADISANRGKLATVSVPSELNALRDVIRDQIVKQRALQGTILDDQENAALAQAAADAATEAIKRVTTRLDEAEAELKAATKAEADRAKLRKNLGELPYKTLKADATTFAASATASDAQALINGNLPKELQDLLVKRYATRTSRHVAVAQALADAEDARIASLGATSGVGEEVAEKETGFVRADRRLREYMQTAPARYASVVSEFTKLQSILQAIKKDPKNPDLLTSREKSDITTTPERASAATKAEAVDDKLDDLLVAEKKLDAGIVTQIDSDVDALATATAVKDLRKDLKTADDALKAARAGVLAGGEKKVMDEWEIIVPDTVWQSFIQYADSKSALAELQSIDPAMLASDLDSTEDAYATALGKAAKAQRRADALSDVVLLRSKRVEASTAALPARLLSAVRGDSY